MKISGFSLALDIYFGNEMQGKLHRNIMYIYCQLLLKKKLSLFRNVIKNEQNIMNKI